MAEGARHRETGIDERPPEKRTSRGACGGQRLTVGGSGGGDGRCSPSCLRPAGAASSVSINTRDCASVCRVAPPGERASYVLHAETQRAARESDSAASAPPAPAPAPEMPSPAPASGSILRPVALRAAAWPAAPPGQLPVTTGVVIGSIDIVGCAAPAGQAMVIQAGQQGAILQPSQLPAAEMQFMHYMQSMFPVPTPMQLTPPPPQHFFPASPVPTPAPSAFKAFVRGPRRPPGQFSTLCMMLQPWTHE